jgi:uncharacterized protein DUF3987
VRLDEFLSLLSGVRKTGSGYMACCPGHDDKEQSLHVHVDERGIGLKCHAGCYTDSILSVLNLGWSDLFAEPSKRERQIIAEYDYQDEEGHLLYQVVRFDPKDFRQRKPEGTGWAWSLNGVRRVPYLLPEVLKSEGPLFIVEGEKDVHTLRVHGFTATTNAGGAGKWDEAWTPYFWGRTIFLVPDTDEPGFDHANRIANLLRDVADVRFIRLYGAKDVTEFFQNHNVESFNLLVEDAPRWEGPVLLREPEPEFEWPAAPIYEGLIGEVVKLLEPHSEADPVALYMELLATFGSCVGPGPHYKIGGTYHRANLFLAVCGETAIGRKGSAHDWVVEVFRQIDPYYVENCMFGGLASGEGVIHAVRDPKTKILKDGSTSIVDAGVTDKRRLFVETELAGRTFTAMRREGNTLSAVLRQAWESSTLAVATKQNDDKATGAHITVVGHATVKELLATLRPEDIAGGFANRFLFFVVRRSKMLPIQTEPDQAKVVALATKFRKALENARKIAKVKLSTEGTKAWSEIYQALDDEAQALDDEQIPFLSRGAAQILRLAMILTLVDGKSEIEPKHLRTAEGLWTYARKSVEFMVGNSSLELPSDQAAMYKLLEKEGRPLSVGEISKALHWSGGKVSIVKGKLLKNRIVHEIVDRNPAGGRPRKLVSIE